MREVAVAAVINSKGRGAPQGYARLLQSPYREPHTGFCSAESAVQCSVFLSVFLGAFLSVFLNVFLSALLTVFLSVFVRVFLCNFRCVFFSAVL